MGVIGGRLSEKKCLFRLIYAKMKPYERLRKVTRHFDFLGLIHASNDNIVGRVLEEPEAGGQAPLRVWQAIWKLLWLLDKPGCPGSTRRGCAWVPLLPRDWYVAYSSRGGLGGQRGGPKRGGAAPPHAFVHSVRMRSVLLVP